MLILVLLGMYFDAVVVFVTSQTLLFRLALAMLCQKSIVLTITPLVPYEKIGKSIYVTYIVIRQKVSLGLSKFL